MLLVSNAVHTSPCLVLLHRRDRLYTQEMESLVKKNWDLLFVRYVMLLSILVAYDYTY